MTHYDHALISEPSIDKCIAELNRTSLNGYEVVAGYADQNGRHYFLIRKKVDPS